MSNNHPTASTGPAKSEYRLFTIISVFAIVITTIGVMSVGNFSTTSDHTMDLARAQRIQKVGSVEVREVSNANRPLASGEEVYKAQCAACHATGVSGAPVFGNAEAWGPRLSQAFEALVQSSLKGKGAMSPQGGGQFSDLEIARGVAFMANAGGGKFEEPKPEVKEGEGEAPAAN